MLAIAADSKLAQGDRTPPHHERYYRPELDALRFFAFLIVFLFHAYYYVSRDKISQNLADLMAIGAFGVPVFYLLSAFLITELLMRERQKIGRIDIKAFYLRRILRIWPIYFAFLFGLTLLNQFAFTKGVGTNDPRAWLSFTFFIGNWYILRHGWIALTIDPIWSISVEEQFYILIPVLVSRGGRRAIYILSVLLQGIAYVTLFLYATGSDRSYGRIWTNSFLQFQFFSAGTILALVLRGRVVQLVMPLRVAAFAAGICFWLAAVVRFDLKLGSPVPRPGIAIAGWMLVFAGSVIIFLSTIGTPSRWIPAAISYLGRISFGLYMFHSCIYWAGFRSAYTDHGTLSSGN